MRCPFLLGKQFGVWPLYANLSSKRILGSDMSLLFPLLYSSQFLGNHLLSFLLLEEELFGTYEKSNKKKKKVG